MRTLEVHQPLTSALPKLERELLACFPLGAEVEKRPLVEVETGYWVRANWTNLSQVVSSWRKPGRRQQRLLAAVKAYAGRGPTLESYGTELRAGIRPDKGLRLFYPKMTLKLRLNSGDASQKKEALPWFFREVEGRQDAQRKIVDLVKIPHVLASGELGDVSYLLEERVSFRQLDCRNEQDRRTMMNQVIPILMDWYRPTAWKPLSTVFGEDLEGLLSRALASPAIADLDPTIATQFRQLVTGLSDYDLEVPFGNCHGDMCLNNACITPSEKLLLLDWENWGVHAIGLEFDRFIQAFGIGGEIHQAIRQRYGAQFNVPAKTLDCQLLIYHLAGFSRILLNSSPSQRTPSRQKYQRYLIKVASDLAMPLGMV